ncbi:MAG: HipA domain-containing protein, partial [Marivita lacus]|nr:HipA domain-containing protein [Marivita lacus]
QTRQAFLEGALVNLLLGNTDNHAKNHGLLYHGARPQLAPFYDIVPVLLDDQVTHQMSFKIGAAEMTDDITTEDIARFLQDLGYRRMTPKLKSRLCEIVSALVARVPEMRGPGMKRLGDAIAEQARWLAPAIGCDDDIPERDLVIINRP